MLQCTHFQWCIFLGSGMGNTQCEIVTQLCAIYFAFILTQFPAFILYPWWKTFCPHFRNTCYLGNTVTETCQHACVGLSCLCSEWGQSPSRHFRAVCTETSFLLFRIWIVSNLSLCICWSPLLLCHFGSNFSSIHPDFRVRPVKTDFQGDAASTEIMGYAMIRCVHVVVVFCVHSCFTLQWVWQ